MQKTKSLIESLVKNNLGLKQINFMVIFNCLFFIALLCRFILQVTNGFSKESWNITEWLINYQGGFVRRGITGQIILGLYNSVGLQPYFVILIISILTYIILVVFFIRNFLKIGFRLSVLLYPFFLGAPIINNFVVRKDVSIMLFFIFIIFLATENPQYFRDSRISLLRLFLINIIFSVGVLTHEELGFIGFPILFLILFSQHKEKLSRFKSVFMSLFKLFPSITTFFACLYFKGSVIISELIWDSWNLVPFPFQNKSETTIPGAVDAVSWSLQKGLSLTIKTFKNFDDGIYAPLIWLIIISSIYYLLSNVDYFRPFNNKPKIESQLQKIYKTNISNILFFQLLGIIPLAVLGWDYGRWVFLWVTSSFSIILLIPAEIIAALLPEFITNVKYKVEIFTSFIFMNNNSKDSINYLLLFLGVPSYGWAMERYLGATPIIIVLTFLSSIFHKFSQLFATFI